MENVNPNPNRRTTLGNVETSNRLTSNPGIAKRWNWLVNRLCKTISKQNNGWILWSWLYLL